MASREFDRARPDAEQIRRPFAPGIVLPSIEYFVRELQLKASNPYGFKAMFNATYPATTGDPCGWVSPWHYGLNQGPVVLMSENYRSELLWRLTRQSSYIVSGVRRAGFRGGRLQDPPRTCRSESATAQTGDFNSNTI